jgi:hypothetical protein
MKESDLPAPNLDYLAFRRIFHYRHKFWRFRKREGQFLSGSCLWARRILFCVIAGGKMSEHRTFQQALEAAGGASFASDESGSGSWCLARIPTSETTVAFSC